MNTFILILTLIIDGGSDGQGGVATAEFNSLAACEKAGKGWKGRAHAAPTWENGSFYMCVEKEI
jgi:hypothetical protein